MILRDRDFTVDPCCNNVVGLVFGGQPSFSSSISTIMAEAHQVHQSDVRDDKIVTVLISFLPEGNKKY